MISFKKHLIYYSSLFAILSLGFVITFNLAPDKRLQTMGVVMTAFFYVTWGILHHFINHDLTVKIVVEYILIGSLGMTIVLFLLKTII
ncbi:MAG: hypothetical protein ABH816_00220 [Candidatus Levyibacteriota bacterium]